jgi:hypothetical protein
MWLFMRSKTGVAMYAAGDNPRFAEAAGINVDKYRIIGTIISTILGAVGILVYAQSFGFYQLYERPMFMPITAVAAILIGGRLNQKGIHRSCHNRCCPLPGHPGGVHAGGQCFYQDMSSMGEISRRLFKTALFFTHWHK